MNALKQASLFLLILGFPTLVFGVGAFDVQPTDKSMVYLGMIFGYVPHMPIPSTNNPLFANMIYIFNQVVFALGLVIVGYTTVVGVVNTAHEGQFLGKEWHPIMVPVRAAAGVMLLLPQTTGYNYIQIIVMWFIIQGVGAANAMWQQVIISNQTQGNIHQDTRKADLTNAKQAVEGMFAANMCVQAVNGNPQALAMLNNERLELFRYLNRMEWGRISKPGEALCGFVDLSGITASFSGGSSVSSTADPTDLFANAINDASSSLNLSAQEAMTNNPASFSFANNFVDAARVLQYAATQASDYTYAALTQLNQEAIDNGWILAGSYYRQLVTMGVYVPIVVSFNAIAPNATAMSSALGSTLSSQILSGMAPLATNYINYVNTSIVTLETGDRAGSAITLRPLPSGGGASSILSIMFGTLFQDITQNLSLQITGGGATNNVTQNDPLIAMTSFGSNLSKITEDAFFIALGIALGVFLASSIFSCINPLGHAMDFALSIFVPLAILCISLLDVAGIILGLYIPMIPYLVFTFSALTWLILVVEAIIAAPLVALSLIVPSEDEIGKAGHAVSILLGIFLRPPLMILGFIMAIQLLIVAIGMLNAAFWATLLASAGGSNNFGIFALIGVILMYAGIAIGMVHEAFSLIYLVPNKVMRWIGAGGEQDDAMQHVKELKGSVQKGAGIGSGMMKGSIGAVTK